MSIPQNQETARPLVSVAEWRPKDVLARLTDWLDLRLCPRFLEWPVLRSVLSQVYPLIFLPQLNPGSKWPLQSFFQDKFTLFSPAWVCSKGTDSYWNMAYWLGRLNRLRLSAGYQFLVDNQLFFTKIWMKSAFWDDGEKNIPLQECGERQVGYP